MASVTLDFYGCGCPACCRPTKKPIRPSSFLCASAWRDTEASTVDLRHDVQVSLASPTRRPHLSPPAREAVLCGRPQQSHNTAHAPGHGGEARLGRTEEIPLRSEGSVAAAVSDRTARHLRRGAAP